MKLDAIVDFWAELARPDPKGRWIHPKDEQMFDQFPHSFDLQFPVSPFVGDILNAPVIVLGLNAGYSAMMTPREFPNAATIQKYVDQVTSPTLSSWELISDYYKTSNSWRFMKERKVVWINASPYRSPNLSTERDNQKLAGRLASTRFHNQWMAEAVMPLARSGDRLVAVKRKSLWTFLPTAGIKGIAACKSFVGKHLDATVVDEIDAYLQSRN